MEEFARWHLSNYPAVIRSYTGQAFKLAFGSLPGMPAGDFQAMVERLIMDDKWRPGDVLGAIVGSICWAKEAPVVAETPPGRKPSTFRPSHWSLLCHRDPARLACVSKAKGNRLYADLVREELIANGYGHLFGTTVASVWDWWSGEEKPREPHNDGAPYHNAKGYGVWVDPATAKWCDVLSFLRNNRGRNQGVVDPKDFEPEDEWWEALCDRLEPPDDREDPDDDPEGREKVLQILVKEGRLDPEEPLDPDDPDNWTAEDRKAMEASRDPPDESPVPTPPRKRVSKDEPKPDAEAKDEAEELGAPVKEAKP